ncbi:hypothetical protein D3Z48_19530 [Clostridiaceae bacterium]|nr:hypothetical protein [Clostridiaceae bacterium]
MGRGKATPSGVFDWTQSGQSRALGDPNQRLRNPQLSALPLSPAEFVLCLASSRMKEYTMNQLGKMRFCKCMML